jgi:PadR family transcriptional regulator, regulatory protein PadR
MAEKSQLLKGILEGCILKVISLEETYGYEIASKLTNSGFSEVSEGTIYPLLIRLEKNGLLKSTLRESSYGPKRKYYSLSLKGKQELQEFLENWNELRSSVDNILK